MYKTIYKNLHLCFNCSLRNILKNSNNFWYGAGSGTFVEHKSENRLKIGRS